MGRAIEWPAAVLVLAEVAILLAGVISRYGFDSPLTWTDELASGLFLWLAMLGAVIALRRGEHMRLDTIAGGLPPATQGFARTLAALAVLVWSAALLRPAWRYCVNQAAITTPALGLPDSWRTAAIPVGVALLALTALRTMLATPPRRLLPALLAGLALAVLLWFARPALLGIGDANLAVFFVGMLGLLVALGTPIGFAFGLATLAYVALMTHAPLTVLASRMDEGMSGIVLLAIPLFVFLGLLLEMTGLAASLVRFLVALLGHVRGGMGMALVGAMVLVSGISGSKAADMAAVAPALFPEMRARGGEPGEMVSLLAASGAMAETIPPSLVLITIGSVAGVSIAGLFTGGLLPACLGATALLLLVRARAAGEPARDFAGWGAVRRSLIAALPALVLPFVIRFAVTRGIATATEVSTLGVVYVAVIGGAVAPRGAWRRLPSLLVETASLSGAILFIIGAATAMAWALTQSGFSRHLVGWITGMPGGAGGFLAVSAVVFTILGSVLEGIPAVVLFAPLLFPAARALGIHEVHYAEMVVLAMGLGLFAPPFGLGFYAACAIGRVEPSLAMRRIWPYLAVLAVAVALVGAVPWLSVGFL